jgi:hypothetical protein
LRWSYLGAAEDIAAAEIGVESWMSGVLAKR